MENRKLVRKKKPPPVVRQTRTSAYRILKSNPLIMCDEDSVRKLGLEKTVAIPKSVDVFGISSTNYNTVQATTINKNYSKNIPQTSLKNNNLCQDAKPKKEASLNNDFKRLPNVLNNKNIVMSKNDTTKNNMENKPSTSILKKAPVRKSLSTIYRQQAKHSKRRSRSAEKFDLNKCFKRPVYEDANSKLEVTLSLDNIQEAALLENDISPIREQRKIIFKTPIAYNRRSITQCTPSTGRKSCYRQFCSTPAPLDLQKRLNEWLTKRGKSLGAFHHLKCFDIHGKKSDTYKVLKENDENKENMTVNYGENAEIDSNGKTDLPIIKNTPSDNKNFDCIARDALDDLHKLVQDGYPLDQCEEWLGRIRHQYHNLEDEPLYWECRAALEQCRGNITSAVEHYRKAIVQGAGVDTIEDSLDQLLKKFSLLNIDSEMSTEDTQNRKAVLEARNAFKTTIIQFAVQERMLKKKEEESKKQIIVTPVRRSTRLSMRCSNNSSVKLCASIKEIDMNENIQFQNNCFLSIRFNQ